MFSWFDIRDALQSNNFGGNNAYVGRELRTDFEVEGERKKVANRM